MKNTTGIKIPKKYQHMIEEVYNDPVKGYWCYSKDGFYFSEVDYAVHMIREDTQSLILEMVRSLEKCECEDCIKTGGKQNDHNV